MKTVAFAGVIFFLFAGCAVDPLEDRNPAHDTEDGAHNQEAIHAWLWAYGSQSDSLHLFHTIDKLCWESFETDMEPYRGICRGGLIGGGIYPTVWFCNDSRLVSFTNGLLDHGDHGHIVHPLRHLELMFGDSYRISDICTAKDGRQIVLCGSKGMQPDVSGAIITVDFLTGDTICYSRPGPVSYVIAGDSGILAGDSLSTDAYILDIDNGSLISSVEVDTPVSDAVYSNATKTAFVAGKEKMVVIDMHEASVLKTVEYNVPGRVTDILASQENDFALGLYDPGSGFSDCFFVVDMKNRTLNRRVVPGAAFATNMNKSTVVLSDDGSVAVMADMVLPVLYRISLSSGTIEHFSAPDFACPVACNYDGTRVWALVRAKAYQVSFGTDEIVDSIDVPEGTDWIMVTSFRDNSSLFDSNGHTF